MNIEQLPVERIGELAAVYNGYAAAVAFTDEVSADRFSSAWQWRDGASARLEGEQVVLVGIEGAIMAGFVHVAVGRFPGPELRGDEDPGATFMSFEDCAVDAVEPVDAAAELSVACTKGEGETRDSISVVARLDGELVGTCEGHSLGNWGSSARSHDTVVLGPMDVEAAFQGKGWGRFLAATMLTHARRLGYRHSATSTEQWNHRAQLFYTNMGYRVIDVAHSYLKHLQGE